MGVCYVPPAGSKQERTRCIERRLEALATEVAAAGAAGTVILGGDFNAKVGDLGSPMQPDIDLLVRGTTCMAVDDHGQRLVAFCERTALVLCTGRALGDTKALLTWGRKQRSASRMDHVLISRRAFACVYECIVPQKKFLSL